MYKNKSYLLDLGINLTTMIEYWKCDTDRRQIHQRWPLSENTSFRDNTKHVCFDIAGKASVATKASIATKGDIANANILVISNQEND